MDVVLGELDRLEVKATFFVLGMTAALYPSVIRGVADRGHELACHGFAHQPVFRQDEDAFREDLRESIDTIEQLSGRRPVGYRAPAFSITRDSLWAYDVLAELGFRYDSSQHDSPRIPRRIQAIPDDAFLLRLPSGRELWEFPVAVWRTAGRSIPTGGGGYWRLFPTSLLLHALHEVARTSRWPVLYTHPYECDPAPLRVALPESASLSQRATAAWRSAYRNAGRTRTIPLLRAIAREFRLVTYEQALAELDGDRDARTRALSPQGVLV